MGRRPVLAALAAVALWTGLLAVALRFETARVQQRIHGIALSQARTLFRQVVDARAWNASHGGVYVPVTEATPPNPYLDVPDRDVRTLAGRELTLVNPAYMTRQLAEITRERRGIEIHLTSLKPLRPANAPEPWERAALEAFERGAAERVEFLVDPAQGREILRYMAPLYVEEACLRCHARQGYRAGQVRGGISVISPADVVGTSLRAFRSSLLAAGAVLWLLGTVLIGTVAVGLRQRSVAAARVRALALLDELTGLHNRRGFLLLAEKQLQISQRTGQPALLLFVDLDGMKGINDRLGHEAGDAALRRTATVLRDSFRASDIIARFGGDEFLVLCPSTGPEAAPTLIQGLARRVQEANASGPAPWRLELSVGTASCGPGRAVSLEDLIREADAAMYAVKQAKRAGR